MEQKITREILTISQVNATERDKAIGARFNQLAMTAFDQAERYLIFGPDTARLAVVKAFLTATSRLAATDAEEALTVHREAYMRELTSMTEVEHHLTHAETEAITVGTHETTNDPDID